MVRFKETSFGEREMTATINDVHYDTPEEICKVTGRNPRSKQIHFILTPVRPAEWKPQNWWLYDSLSEGSSWHDVVKRFLKLDVISDADVEKSSSNFELAKLIQDKLDGKKVKFIERRIGKSMSPNWYPQEIEG